MEEEFDERDEAVAEAAPPLSPGTRLRLARQARGLSLAQVSSETRITERHLELIEDDALGELPGRTYAIGFSRSFARTVGENEGQIVEGVRALLDELAEHTPHRPDSFEPADPARVPSSKLGWAMGFALLVLLAGGYAFYSTYFSPGAELGSIVEDEAAPAPGEGGDGASPAAQPTGGPVIFTATDDEVWVRFYDGEESNVLQEVTLSEGDTYRIPDDAEDPRIRTGRPDAMSITIGGQRVAPLAEDDFVMSGVSVSAAGLLARSEEGAASGADADEDAAENPRGG